MDQVQRDLYISLQEKFHFHEIGKGQFAFKIKEISIDVKLLNFASPVLYSIAYNMFVPRRKEINEIAKELIKVDRDSSFNEFKFLYIEFMTKGLEYFIKGCESIDKIIVRNFIRSMSGGNDVEYLTKLISMVDLAIQLGADRLNEFIDLAEKGDTSTILKNQHRYPFAIIEGDSIDDVVRKTEEYIQNEMDEEDNGFEEIDLANMPTIGEA